jgi:N-acetylmuramoyl-L-alanine amidase
VNIIKDLLPVNGFSRSGRKIEKVRGVVLHYLGASKQTAKQARDYFSGLANQDSTDNIPDRSASAHYIIDFDGTILLAIPEDEKAYHCGSSQKDFTSGRIYTEKARSIFGAYASHPDETSPNTVSIGIEMCHVDGGIFTNETLEAAIELCSDICTRYSLDPETQILTHKEVVGWKDCPLLWAKNPDLFSAFKREVAMRMVENSATNNPEKNNHA